MTTELHDALARAAEEGRASFELRDATDVIAPASRRVRRQRAGIVTASTVGIVVLASGALWGMESLGGTRLHGFDPAVTPSDPAHADDPMAEIPWSTLALAVGAEPRAMGEKREDSVAGMICHHAKPEDDPRVAIRFSSDSTSHVTSVENCEPVWFKNGPITTDGNATASSSDGPASLSAQAVIVNTSSRPLAIDTESVFMWVETAPDVTTNKGLATFSGMIVGPSMWDASGETTALLDSADDETVVAPGAAFVARSTSTQLGSGNSPLSDVVTGDAPYTVSFWARIHEENPSGDATYLIQLGESHTFGGAPIP